MRDHPYTDPGDGRTECVTCGKWVFPVTHSCKGVPVTAAAKRRFEAPLSGAERAHLDQLRRLYGGGS